MFITDFGVCDITETMLIQNITLGMPADFITFRHNYSYSIRPRRTNGVQTLRTFQTPDLGHFGTGCGVG